MARSTEILKIKGDWQEVLDDCRVTVGKRRLDREPSKEFKKRILIAEHSPIRDIAIKWIWRGIMSYVATHFSRHKWECFIETQRSDRVGMDTSKNTRDAPVNFVGSANVQSLIDTWRKRLCCQASEETRKKAEDFKLTLHAYEPEIADVLIPNCIYRCGCPEMQMCKERLWPSFVSWCRAAHINPFEASIGERYRLYNEWFRGVWSVNTNAEVLQ